MIFFLQESANPVQQNTIITTGTIQIIALVLPVFSLIIGIIMTYIITSKIETKKWKQQNEKEKAIAKREALGIILEWIDPISDGVRLARNLINQLDSKEIDDSRYRELCPDFNNLISDLPARYNVFLPESIKGRLRGILLLFEGLKVVVASYNPDNKDWIDNIDNVGKSLKKLRDDIEAEYLKTYDY